MNFLYILASLGHFSQGIASLAGQPLYYYLRRAFRHIRFHHHANWFFNQYPLDGEATLCYAFRSGSY